VNYAEGIRIISDVSPSSNNPADEDIPAGSRHGLKIPFTSAREGKTGIATIGSVKTQMSHNRGDTVPDDPKKRTGLCTVKVI